MEDGAANELTLADGRVARLSPRDGGWTLVIDGVAQSHVGPPGQAPVLAYARWMSAAIGGGAPVRAAHLGGGLLTVPRVVADRRPGSRQVVWEIEPALVALASGRFPAPEGVEVREADARAALEAAEPGSADLVTIDVFAGGRIPPAFSSVEAARAARRALAPGGRLVVNSVAGAPLQFTRRQLAGLRETFPHVALIVQGSSLGGLRFGNACLVASDAELDAERIRAELRGDPSKGALVTDLDGIVDDAAPLTDAEAQWSPEPDLPDASRAIAALDEMSDALRRLLPGR
ncbi:fused MFS/spermidine synthase [Microbacterium sp. ZXX196]|uniref:spermidine synthase n=1 Tax=Microbacterium sp. ZXX196 TaxID=2609291 RepID=UPI0012B8EB0C|nr:hypothetical protein [Microbacterium sp. ZXX196]